MNNLSWAKNSRGNYFNFSIWKWEIPQFGLDFMKWLKVQCMTHHQYRHHCNSIRATQLYKVMQLVKTVCLLQAVTSVTETLTTVIAGGTSSGTEMTTTAFTTAVSEFLSITQADFVSVKITSLALTIITAKVTTAVADKVNVQRILHRFNCFFLGQHTHWNGENIIDNLQGKFVCVLTFGYEI